MSPGPKTQYAAQDAGAPSRNVLSLLDPVIAPRKGNDLVTLYPVRNLFSPCSTVDIYLLD